LSCVYVSLLLSLDKCPSVPALPLFDNINSVSSSSRLYVIFFTVESISLYLFSIPNKSHILAHCCLVGNCEPFNLFVTQPVILPVLESSSLETSICFKLSRFIFSTIILANSILGVSL